MAIYNKIKEELGIDDIEQLYPARLYEITSKMDKRERQHLVKMIDDAIYNENAAKKVIKRIALCRLLVALIPTSLDLIKKAIRQFDSEYDYEIHFTLFCYLDHIQDICELSCYKNCIVSQVHNYLLSVKKETASSAWMAGDLIGDHWRNVSESERILFDVLENGKYAPGRKGAIDGLAQLLRRSTESKRKIITMNASSVINNDKSDVMKKYWERILGHVDKG